MSQTYKASELMLELAALEIKRRKLLGDLIVIEMEKRRMLGDPAVQREIRRLERACQKPRF